MAVLLNKTYPYFTILYPADGSYRSFSGGKLEITEEDPAYSLVMEEASRNPYIIILDKGVQCDLCGEVFAGSAGKAQLGKHRKDVHFDEWVAEKVAPVAEEVNAEVKARAGVVCDACRPAQVFATDNELQNHVNVVHMALPAMDEEGNEIGRRDEDGGAAPTSVPAATRKT